jgi:hypothetical protein
MGHIPDDDNYNEWMNASAEDWSKPQESNPPSKPQGETDRWGSPVASKETQDDPRRWGSEAPPPKTETYSPENANTKKGLKPWIIVVIVAVVLCLCVCAILAGLGAIFPAINIFGSGNLF